MDHFNYRWCEVRSQSLSLASPWPATLTLHDISKRVQQEQVDVANLRSLTRLIKGLPAMVYRARNNRHWSMEYMGGVLCFPHGSHPQHCVHAGEPIRDGAKYIIRSDILF